VISGMDDSPHDAASFAVILFLLETTEDAVLNLSVLLIISFMDFRWHNAPRFGCVVPLWFAAL